MFSLLIVILLVSLFLSIPELFYALIGVCLIVASILLSISPIILILVLMYNK